MCCAELAINLSWGWMWRLYSAKSPSNNMDIFLTIHWSPQGLSCASLKGKPFEINAHVSQALPEPSSVVHLPFFPWLVWTLYNSTSNPHGSLTFKEQYFFPTSFCDDSHNEATQLKYLVLSSRAFSWVENKPYRSLLESIHCATGIQGEIRMQAF